jgi:hypothetical protein
MKVTNMKTSGERYPLSSGQADLLAGEDPVVGLKFSQVTEAVASV